MKNLVLFLTCCSLLFSCKEDSNPPADNAASAAEPTEVSNAAPSVEAAAENSTAPPAENAQPAPQPGVKNAAKPAGNNSNQTPPSPIVVAPTLQSQGITEPHMTADESGQVIKGERPVDALSIGIAEKPRFLKDSVEPKPVAPQPKTPQESRIVRVLTNNYWVVWALHRTGKDARQTNRTNQGAWFKFNTDGSYTYGFFEKTVGKGAWTFDGKNATIFMDGELLGDDREWSFKISKEEDVMVWLGTGRFHTQHVQMKLINLLFIPKNRKEVGLED